MGEGTLGGDELAEDHVLGIITCEGGRDVVGVVTSLFRGVAQDFHGDQVVELSVQLAVQEVEGKRQGRTDRRRKGEATQGDTLMDDDERG